MCIIERFPRITIITPSYNQATFIEKTIQSVLSQNYPNLEYIVMDGGSKDGTVEILKQYDGQLRWFSEPDRGQSHAINKGLQMATGEVVAYLNSDDCYEPGALLRVGNFFARHPNASWMTGQCRIMDSEGNEVRKLIKWYKNVLLLFKSYPLLQVADYVSQPATFWRRNVLETVGLFDESQQFVMDYNYSLRVGKQYKMWVMHQPLASFRIHTNSKSSSYTSALFGDDLETAAQFTRSTFLLKLHAVHSALIVGIYWYVVNQHRIALSTNLSSELEINPSQDTKPMLTNRQEV